ncbi:MAG: hypothetical protein M3Q03_06905 [Chloroflexota bacterium]|nr:hypothetical protein [Chloroflexota bacterium]
MKRDPAVHGHESVNHDDPAATGLLHDPSDPATEVPGTGILGDETLVRDADDAGTPGIAPAPASGTGNDARPGPGRVSDER